MSRDWLDSAACAEVGSDVFFPPQGGDPRPAIRICQQCPVRQHCLQAALELGASGVWGGTTAAERQRMGGNVAPIADLYLRQPCGSKAANRRHERAGEACVICRVAA